MRRAGCSSASAATSPSPATRPANGWHVSIDERSDREPGDARRAVRIERGGLASSSTVVRRWLRGGRRMHHVVDPWTGEPAAASWRLVSVAAPSCLLANAASTAAIVWGPEARDRLAGLGFPARLVAADGTVTVLGGWPAGERGEGALP